MVSKRRAVVEINTARELADAWRSLLDHPGKMAEIKEGVSRMFTELGGACEKSLAFTLQWLNSRREEGPM